jgi:hypothetical protein
MHRRNASFVLLMHFSCEFPGSLRATQVRYVVVFFALRIAPPRRYWSETDTILLRRRLVTRWRICWIHAATCARRRRLTPGLRVAIRLRAPSKRIAVPHTAILCHPTPANCSSKNCENNKDHKSSKNHAIAAVQCKSKATIRAGQYSMQYEYRRLTHKKALRTPRKRIKRPSQT